MATCHEVRQWARSPELHAVCDSSRITAPFPLCLVPLVSCLRESLVLSVPRVPCRGMQNTPPQTVAADRRRAPHVGTMGASPEDGAATGPSRRAWCWRARTGPIGRSPRRLRVSSNSVCKWRERFRVRRLEGLADEPRPGRRGKSPTTCRGRHHAHARRSPAADDAMDHAQHGGGRGAVESDDLAHLAHLRPAIASRRHVQALGRPAICREGARHRRAVSESA